MSATFALNNSSTATLTGQLHADTVNALLELGRAAIQHTDQQQFTIDLSAVDDSSSAGVALLLAWRQVAHLMSKQLIFKNIPARMQSIIDFSNLNDVLSISR